MPLPDPPTARDWLSLMQAETRRRAGSVPNAIGAVEVGPGTHWLAGDEFLLRESDGIALHYRKGEGVTVEAPAGTDPREVELWLNGTLHAAIAAINGLFPLHASAVAHRGKVYAFSGPNGPPSP